MRLDNPPTDRQSHAGALWFGGEERLENVLYFSDREADARITHRNQYLIILVKICCSCTRSAVISRSPGSSSVRIEVED
jgi:hypothetical protein